MLKPKDGSEWMVVYTYPRFEQKIVKELTRLQIETFLPTHEVVSDRKKKLVVPLFPSYLFVRTLDTNRWKVLATNGVVKFISIKNQPCLVSDDTISAIRKACTRDVNVVDQMFNEGDEVEVATGPLSGLKGILTEKKGRTRLAISIELMKQSVLVDVNVEDLKQKMELTY